MRLLGFSGAGGGLRGVGSIRVGPGRPFWGADGGVSLCLLSEPFWIDEDALLSEVSVSLQSHYVSGCIFLLSPRPPPLPIPPAPPLVCRRGTAPSSSVYPLYPNTPFCRAAFYLYLAGDWQLTFCTGGNFWERGQCQWVSCISPSFWDPLYTFMYLSSYLFIPTPIQRHTPPLLSAFSSSLLLFSGMNNWPGFNFLSFPATANWKTPLKCRGIAKKDHPLSLPLSLCPSFKAKRQWRVHLTGWLEPSVDGTVWCQHLWVLSAQTIIGR